MSEPTLQDCINYMRSQIKQMEKHPRNYEFNLPYYRKTVELLETRKTNDEIFEWCHDCKEYDQKEHCCHRWTKVIRDTVDELEKDRRPQGEWIDVNGDGSLWKCSNCNEKSCCRGNFCSDCGSDNRPRKHGCCFADETCKNNPCKDCGLREGEENGMGR